MAVHYHRARGEVWGRHDGLVPLAVGERFNKDIAGSKMIVIEESAHVPNVEKPAEFNAAVLKFLTEQ
jgi:3-oxoadipate enol-lactonase